MNYTREEINSIILSGMGLSYGQKRGILSGFTSSEPDFKNCTNLLIKTPFGGVYNKVEDAFSDRAYRDGILNELEEKGISCVTYFSSGYPESLKSIPEPPLVLYCKGDTALLKTKCFSIVGSRQTIPKYSEICAQFAEELSREFTIVSGGAEGADSRAMDSALKNGGRVIGVLAGGLDSLYPSSNASLFRRVAESGLLVTEQPLYDKPKPYYFPFRNRIVAGLSVGTLVVSASERSGTSITAGYALEYGREVFALPYSVGITTGEGCNLLLKKGAILARNVLDIFNEFGLDFKRRRQEPLGKLEAAVYGLIKSSEEAHISLLAAKLNKSVPEISVAVTSLTMKGLIVGTGGNRFTALK